MMLRAFIDRLPERIRWTPHNLLAHPADELLYLLTGRQTRIGGWLHDATVPTHVRGEGRG
jgi:hypothetical protein